VKYVPGDQKFPETSDKAPARNVVFEVKEFFKGLATTQVRMASRSRVVFIMPSKRGVEPSLGYTLPNVLVPNVSP
jgi:hypothetical protein